MYPGSEKPHFIVMSGLVCGPYIMQPHMERLGKKGDVHFVDYYSDSGFDTISKMADRTFRLIQEKIPDQRPIVLVTFSMGGYISPVLLEKMSADNSLGMISAVCGIESSPFDDDPARREVRNRLLDQVGEGKFESHVIPSLLNGWFGESGYPDIREKSGRMIAEIGPDIFVAQLTAIRDRMSTIAQQRFFTMPVLTIAGEESPVFKTGDSRFGNQTALESLVASIPSGNHQVVSVKGAGHLVPVTHAPEVGAAIDRFLNELGLAPPSANPSALQMTPESTRRRAKPA
jgi:pimeloyl-ACP methyl ester carboxylesterase